MRPTDSPSVDLHCDDELRVVTGCTEGRRYEIAIDWPVACRLLIDEVEVVPAAAGSNRWTWEAGFFAGEVMAVVLDDRASQVGAYRIDVSPDPAKLGRLEFQRMVDELCTFEPRLVFGHEASQAGIGASGDFLDPHLAYARLRLHGERFVKATQELCKRPQVQLFHRRELQPAHKVRRLDLQSIRAALRNAGALSMLLRREDDSIARAADFDVPASYEGVDTPGNRVMLHVLRSVRRRARTVLKALEFRALRAGSAVEREALAARMPARRAFLSGLDARLASLQERRPFDEVVRSEVSAAGLNAISAHPLYSRAYRAGWRVLRPGIDGSQPSESLWMSPTWAIFERWCFLVAFNAVRALYPSATWERRFPSTREDCVHFRGHDGSQEVNLYLQPRFPAYKQPSALDFNSISGERYPDIVITATSGGVERFLVLDAKYRVTRANVLDAMVSAHLYRDSLRWRGHRAVVCLLLVPAGGGASWLEEPEFWSTHGVGVAVVHQHRASEQLVEVLKHWIAS